MKEEILGLGLFGFLDWSSDFHCNLSLVADRREGRFEDARKERKKIVVAGKFFICTQLL